VGLPDKEITRNFGAHGYNALCPNLYAGKGSIPIRRRRAAARAKGGVPDEQFLGDVSGAIDALRALPSSNGKVGVIGTAQGATVVPHCREPPGRCCRRLLRAFVTERSQRDSAQGGSAGG